MITVRKRYLLRILFISFFSLALYNHSWAQPSPDDPFGGGNAPDPGDPSPDDDPGGGGYPDPDLPIDTNILVLVGGVVLYGLKKLWDVKQNKKKQNSLQTTANYTDFIK